jgi:hypothetical protein
VGLGAVGGGAAIAAGGDDDATEKTITGSALEQAKATALAHTGEGRVTETEVDEESYYEVEVILANGSEVDVQLDEDFNVVGSKNEDDEGGRRLTRTSGPEAGWQPSPAVTRLSRVMTAADRLRHRRPRKEPPCPLSHRFD